MSEAQEKIMDLWQQQSRDPADSDDVEMSSSDSPKELSPTALKLDDWSLRKGKEVLDECKDLRKVLDIESGNPKERREKRDAAELVSADFHSAAFELDHHLAENCKNEKISRYMKALLETPEFKALHNETQLDEVASEIACLQFTTQYVEYVKMAEPKNEFEKEMQAMAAAGKAVGDAKKEVSDAEDLKNALGLGGDGAKMSKFQKDKISELFKKVRGNKRIRNIVNLAGRYRRFARAQQRKRTIHGTDDVVGVELGGEISRLIPQELCHLADPELEMDAMRRIVEREAQVFQMRGIEPQARGPIVVVVDESGSMDGQNIENAKAIALALAWVARNQRRWYCLVGFSGGTGGTFCVCPPDGVPRFRDFENKSQKDWSEGYDALATWLEHFYSGGTCLDVPLEMLPKQWEKIGTPKGKTDIIMITDAIVNVPANLEKTFNEWRKAEKAKSITIVLGDQPGEMPKVSDTVHCVKSLSVGEQAVAEALSV